MSDVNPLLVVTLVIAVLIPVTMIAGGIWFVSWYMQRKIRRDLARERDRDPPLR